MQFDGIFWPEIKGIQDGEYKLVRTMQALSVLENPHNNLQNVIHVGGTNGKGSCASFIKNILNAHGCSVNVYTSPHLVHVNERFQVHSKEISNEMLKKYTAEVYYKLKEKNLEESLTFFEALTVLAFYIFEKEKSDFNIIEVGLGGRFDSTNVLQNTLISVLTSISMDHQDYLGNTLELIAGEKAEIIKPNSMVAVGMQSRKSIYEIFANKAKSVNAKLEICQDLQNVAEEIDGSYQKENANLSLIAVQMIGEKLGINFEKEKCIWAIKTAKWAGRLDGRHIKLIDKNIVLDCAHNIDGIKNFLQYIAKKQSGNNEESSNKGNNNESGVLIVGMLRRKFTSEIAQIFKQFLEENKSFKLLATNFEDFDECMPASEFAKTINHENCLFEENLTSAFLRAKSFESIFVCGSIHFAGFLIKNFC